MVLAVLWYSVRVGQWWCEERDLSNTHTDLQWCWLCCGTQLGWVNGGVRRGIYVLPILTYSGVVCAVVLSKGEAVAV